MLDTASGQLMTGVHATSARAALLVAIGEFVWPSHRPVWSSTLLAFLAEMGFEANAARKAIARTAESGLVESQRDGRRVRWVVTDQGERVLALGAHRIYHWHERPRTWDGRWLIVIVPVPEENRTSRHHLQKQLRWAGLGSPVPGQWISPHPDRVDEVERIVRDLGLLESAQAFVGVHAAIGDENQLARGAWPLATLAEEYREFVVRFDTLVPEDDRDSMVRRIELVQQWRRLVFLDPDLPREHLPEDWPGDEATAVFLDRYHRWSSRSQRYWDQLDVAAAGTGRSASTSAATS